uniref:S6m2-RNase n=1 Tax=Prunus cerasus TaxID=140311 RepID=Q06Z79_9ROSA|nr:S6m2-RNase [Prunus cerasus]
MAMLKSSPAFLVLAFAFFLCFIMSNGSYVYFQFVQQWPPTNCRVRIKRPCSSPRPLQYFTIHGLCQVIIQTRGCPVIALDRNLSEYCPLNCDPNCRHLGRTWKVAMIQSFGKANGTNMVHVPKRHLTKCSTSSDPTQCGCRTILQRSLKTLQSYHIRHKHGSTRT